MVGIALIAFLDACQASTCLLAIQAGAEDCRSILPVQEQHRQGLALLEPLHWCPDSFEEGKFLVTNVVCVACLQKWAAQEDVVYARPLASAGDHVTSVEDGLPTWVCEVMVTKPTMEEALQFVRNVETDVDARVVITSADAAKKAVPDCLGP